MNKNETVGVFLDRDGVITELPSYKQGEEVEFILSKGQIKFVPKSIEGIRIFNEYKIPVILITNQPQIARGLSTIEKVEDINEEIIKLLKENNAIIKAIYYCPHHPTKGINKYKINCECRKPKPGLISKAAKDHNIILEKSYMVGDKISDIKAGKLAGCKTIGVKTGYACNDSFNDAKPDIMVENLFEAAKIITNKI